MPQGARGATAVEVMLIMPLVVALFVAVIWFALLCVDVSLARFTRYQLARADTHYVYPMASTEDDNPVGLREGGVK